MRPARRRVSTLLLAALLPLAAGAGPVEDELVVLQHDWEVIRYQTPAFERERLFEALAARAHALSAAQPQRGDALAWEGTIVESWGEQRRGLGALRLAWQARALYEAAIRLDPAALDGTALPSLAALYCKAPGWPFGFGDKEKARALLERALQLRPDGLDANLRFGEFLLETGRPSDARPYLERAVAAPVRPGHQVGDTGRREEARGLLEKARASR